uniref:Uncharacterized protein n=1 Tax=Romanomermis culicivorax TaxID=13658 RepID=A0A915I786_ROMCU
MYQTLPHMKDLQNLYKNCLNYKKSDLYSSPLVEKIFRACGGDAIFNPDVEVEKDIEQVMADVHRNFGSDSVFSFPVGNSLQMDALFSDEFNAMNRVYRKLYNGSEPDSKISNIFEQISKVQYDINHGGYRYGPTSYTKSQLKTRLKNHTVDWVKYVELSVMTKESDIIVNMDDLKTKDEIVKKYGKRYIIFS